MAAGVMILVNPPEQFRKSNDARRKSDLVQIQKVLEQYYNDNGKYPYSTRNTGCGSCTSACVVPYSWKIKPDPAGGGDCLAWGYTWDDYKTLLPKDPLSSNRYVYSVSSDNQTYYLYAHLERNIRDSQTCCPADDISSGNTGCSCPNAAVSTNGGPGDGNACGTSGSNEDKTCNYGVTSPNTTP